MLWGISFFILSLLFILERINYRWLLKSLLLLCSGSWRVLYSADFGLWYLQPSRLHFLTPSIFTDGGMKGITLLTLNWVICCVSLHNPPYPRSGNPIGRYMQWDIQLRRPASMAFTKWEAEVRGEPLLS